ncbi:MAG TPA: hypothetical protein VNY73_03335, partial [Bacteroidia bacterium]|nr:hypothetical protein [Bacteroidia bacterium]
MTRIDNKISIFAGIGILTMLISRPHKIFYAIVLAAFLGSCGSKKDVHKADFVYLEDKIFKLNGKDFYPMILNYGAELMMDNKNLWVSPNTGYGDKDIQHNEELGLLKFKADMQMIKDLGFNTVRICGIGEYNNKDGVISKYADIGRDTIIILSGNTLEKYFHALSE